MKFQRTPPSRLSVAELSVRRDETIFVAKIPLELTANALALQVGNGDLEQIVQAVGNFDPDLALRMLIVAGFAYLAHGIFELAEEDHHEMRLRGGEQSDTVTDRLMDIVAGPRHPEKRG